MKKEDLTESELEDKIELYKDRIETLNEYLAEISDLDQQIILKTKLESYYSYYHNYKLSLKKRKDGFKNFKPIIEISNLGFLTNKIITTQEGRIISTETYNKERYLKLEDHKYQDSNFAFCLFNFISGKQIPLDDEIESFPIMYLTDANNNQTTLKTFIDREKTKVKYSLVINHKGKELIDFTFTIHNKNIVINFLK